MKEKIRNFFNSFAMFTLLACIGIWISACEEDNPIEPTNPNESTKEKITVEPDNLEFEAENNEELVITVTVTPKADWTFVSSDWIKCVKEDNTLKVMVEDNPEEENREGEIVFTTTTASNPASVSINVSQKGAIKQAEDVFVYREYPFADMSYLSPEGKYIAAIFTEAEGTMLYSIPVLIDVEADEVIYYDQLRFSHKQYAGAVDDNGVMYIYGEGQDQSYRIKDGQHNAVPDYNGLKVSISDTNGDGTLLVGYTFSHDKIYIPLKMVNGVYEEMQMPPLNSHEGEWWHGVMARGCSPDGSVIYGSSWDTYSPIAWDKDGNMYNVGDDLFEKKLVDVDFGGGLILPMELYSEGWIDSRSTAMSNNGRYISFLFRKVDFDDPTGVYPVTTYAAYYDTELRETTLAHEQKEIGVVTVLDDKTIFFYGSYDSENYALDTAISSTPIRVGGPNGWLKHKFNIETERENLSVNGISLDGKTVYGIIPPNNGLWYITSKKD